jgi:hypothetical protein
LLEPGLGAAWETAADDDAEADAEMEAGDAQTAANTANTANATDAAGLALVEARDFSELGRIAYEALLAGGAVWVTSPAEALHSVLGAQRL